MISKLRNLIGSQPLLKKGLIDTNYYFLAQVGSRVLGFLIIPLFARLLTIEEFAYYDLFILASGFLVLLTGLGLDSGMAIKITENKENIPILNGLLFTTLLLSISVSLLLWICAGLVIHLGLFSVDFTVSFINGLFIYTIIYQYNYIIYSFVRWLGNARIAAIISFTSYVLGILCGIGYMTWQGNELNNYIIGAIVGSTLGALLTTYQAREFLKVKLLPKKQFDDLMKLSLPYVPTYLSSYLMQFIDRLLITSYFGFATLGLYSLANRVGQVITFSLQIISSGFRPIITSNYENEAGQGLSRKIFNAYWILLVPVCILSVLLSPFIVELFGGQQYIMAVPILPYIILSVWFLSSFFLFGFGYQIKRKTIYVTLITFAVVLMVYGFSVVLIPVVGVLAIAQSTAGAAMIGSVSYILISEKMYPFKYNFLLMFGSISLSAIVIYVLVRIY